MKNNGHIFAERFIGHSDRRNLEAFDDDCCKTWQIRYIAIAKMWVTKNTARIQEKLHAPSGIGTILLSTLLAR
ncbi:hypothetical protein D3C85_1825250 [compost metagenome]